RLRVGRLRTPLQDIEPPWVVGMMHAHVIWHEIEDQTHVRAGERRGQPLERGFAAEFGVERVVIDHVVAVAAAGARLEEGRGVEVTDAQCLEIGNKRGGIVEAEGFRELQAIGRNRDCGRHHPPPMLQSTAQDDSPADATRPQMMRFNARSHGPGALLSERLASNASCRSPANDQLAESTCPSMRAVRNAAADRCGTMSRRRIARRSRTSARRLLPAGVSRSAQSRIAAENVSSDSGSGISLPNAAYACLNSCRRPWRTASVSALWKSQKNGNGRLDPHSSPMKRSGGIGASSVTASAASRPDGFAWVMRRPPNGRLPIWS